MEVAKNKWNTVDIYSIEKHWTGVDTGCMLERRTATPVVLAKGLKLCGELESKGHVVEIRRVT